MRLRCHNCFLTNILHQLLTSTRIPGVFRLMAEVHLKPLCTRVKLHTEFAAGERWEVLIVCCGDTKLPGTI